MGVAISSGVANPEPQTVNAPSTKSTRPVQDEWGFYDPEQAGFEAVLRKLNRDAEAQTTRPAASAAGAR